MSTPESAAETSNLDTTEPAPPNEPVQSAPASPAATPPATKAPWWKRLMGQG